MPSVLVTGANRGLGFEFSKQYSVDGWRVFACCRSPGKAKGLNDLALASKGRLSLHPLDIAHRDSVSFLAEALRDETVDILLNNAGVYGDESHYDFGKIDYEKWGATFSVNVMGAMRMVEAFLENVSRSEKKLIACLSSKMGSISDNTSGGSYVYRSSKAALNAVLKSLSLDLKDRGIVAVALHPGWVRTDMGGKNAPTRPEESVQGMRKVLARLQAEDSGKFFSYEGPEVPW
jgi:NAD(P)-dependent dehydrogenase (short-subunit alcohol dehydrogenase family)